jgi:hypothetical protein
VVEADECKQKVMTTDGWSIFWKRRNHLAILQHALVAMMNENENAVGLAAARGP